MDHSSIGDPKLRDFMKSLPEICRMTIAPVGNSPATHSVLLPAEARSRRVTIGPIRGPLALIIPDSHPFPAPSSTSPIQKLSLGIPFAAYAHQQTPPTSLIEIPTACVNGTDQEDYGDVKVTYVCFAISFIRMLLEWSGF
ncbi:hypothetical protein R1flu_012811 [Riccia fluitans]|uniref:Uncharacterized protein n=1 Tax=Riccia fluitans TaxID=41844 RepID=A0ABD1ZBN5_9MARC